MKRVITESNEIQRIFGKYLENLVFKLEDLEMSKFWDIYDYKT